VKELLEPDAAKKVVTQIGEAIMKLEELPLRNGLVSDEKLSIKGTRRIIIDNFIVFYIANEETRLVTIVRIQYNRRDWINLL
jgi:toxin ParE1/3/4